MSDNLISNEKLIDNISLRNADVIPAITFGQVIQNYDKDHPKKVKVKLRSMMGTEDNEVWADVLTSYCGGDYGNYIIPEVNSVVVVAFAMNNRNFPVVVGNIWTAQENLPANSADKDNYIKTFRTQSGNQITINDTKDKSSISVKTIKEISVMLDDENQKISISDKDKKNKFEMDLKNGTISIDAKESISLKVGGTEVINIDKQTVDIKTKTFSAKADSKVNLKGGQVAVEGTSMDLKSSSNLNIKATANLSAEATGMAKVKGSLLNLN